MASGSTRENDGGFYRIVWRWHFYAGLIVLPFLVWLAVTGALYLYKPEVERLVYGRWSHVEPIGAPVPLDRLVAAFARQGGGTVTMVMRPADPAASWRMSIRGGDGGMRTAFVDPYRARLLGSVEGAGFMATIRSLHSLAITGPVGNALIEVVAGWAVLLVLTGLYLWWPRRGSPVIALRGRPSGRLFWRDFHTAVGLLAGAVILFLALTGMPWTMFAGKQLQRVVAAQGLGRPAAPAIAAGEHRGHDGKESLPWAMQEAAHPMGHAMGDIGPARVADIAAGQGMKAPWSMTFPMAPGAPYLVSRTVARAEDAHVLYIDAASGTVLQDARYADFGAGARAIEWGIATHQGLEYGEPNRLLMLWGCIAILLLAASAPILWWKRRGGQGLRPPARAADRAKARGVAAIMLAVGMLFPLTGLSMLAALILDRLGLALRRIGRASA